MAFKVGAIVAKLTLDKSDWNKAQQAVHDDQKKMQGMSDTTARKFKAVGTAMTVAGAMIVAALGKMVNKASEAEETYAKFGTIFSSVIGEAEEKSKDLAKSYGLSTLASKDMLAATGDLLTGLGMMPAVALDLSEKTQQLAVDLASFTNFSGGAKGASEALTKAMLGERESIKSLGIVITEEMVKEGLLADGKEKLTGLAKKEAAAEVTLEIAYRQSLNAVGDYERTSESLANQKRLLAARIENLQVIIGTKLIPVVTTIIVKISDVVEKVSTWMEDNPKLTATIVEIAAGIGSLMLVLGPLLIIIPKIGAAFATLTAGPMAAIIAAFVLLASVALKAKKEFKESMELYQDEMDITGRKTSWLERTLGSIDAAWSKLALGIDTNAIAMQAYNEKMREADGVMSVVKGTGWVLSNGIGFLKDKFVELTTAMGDTDDEAGEVDTTIRRLSTGLGITAKEADELRREWADLLDVLDQEVMGEMVEVIEDGEMWLEMLALEAEETGGVMAEVFGNIGLDYKALTEGVEDETERVTEIINPLWANLGTNLSGSFGAAFEDILTKGSDFSDALNLLFDGLVNSIKGFFGQMVTDFLANNVFDFMSTAASEASKSVASTVGDLVGGAKETSKAAAGAISGIWTGVGAAVGTLVAGLITGKGGPSSEDSWHFKQIWINSQALKPMEGAIYDIRGHVLRTAVQTEGVPKKLDISNRHLDQIKKNTDPIKNMVSAQHGAVVTGPTLAALHGTSSDPEIVSPVSKLIEGLKGFGGGGSSLKQQINVNIMVKDHLDPYSAQRIVREQIVPNMLKAIEVDSRKKTRMREILGVQV